MNLLKRLRFQFWYFSTPPWDTGVSPPELLAFLDAHPPGRALDLGCGTGTNVITMAQRGWQAVGVDFAWRAVRTAREKARRAGVEAQFFIDNAAHLRHSRGGYDLVLDMGCFHSLDDKERAEYRQQLPELLASGGTYMLYVFFKDPGAPGPGVSEADLPRNTGLLLEEHQDGSERGWRPSAWLTYRKAG